MRYVILPYIDEQGRAKVNVRLPEGRRALRTVSQYVASAFIGPRPAGLDVLHDDGRPDNNCANNLYYGTKVQNMADKLRHGTQPLGEMSHLATHTEAQVIAVRTAIAAGERQTDIALRLGVDTKWCSDVHRGVSWKHVQLVEQTTQENSD